VPPTAFQTKTLTLALILTLTLTSDLVYGHVPHTCTLHKAKGGSKVRVKTDRQTDGRTEAIALPPVLKRSLMA